MRPTKHKSFQLAIHHPQAPNVMMPNSKKRNKEGETYATLSPPTPLSFLTFASPTNRSNSFNCLTASLSARISSNSAFALSSNFAFNCLHTLSKLAGTCFAGVGKHPLKFAYEFARSVRASALSKISCSLEARGPGVRGTGAGGGGEGEAPGLWADGLGSVDMFTFAG